MYYTGIHPMTGKPVYVCTDYREKQLQRALLQYSKPENANLVREALRAAGKEDLIGYGPECLVRPAFGGGKDRADAKRPGAKRAPAKKPQASRRAPTRAAEKEKPTKRTKLEKAFGADAVRIRREADRLSGSGKNTKNNRKKYK
jgi:hypothetical protein